VEFCVNKLGFQPAFTWGEPPTFAGVSLGKVQIFLAKGSPTPRATPAIVLSRTALAVQSPHHGERVPRSTP
ncbi:MAG TPA: hypothetical protein VKO18_13400, partial [Terriglobia bacterium]|nr:hypothetical protein [Terriglobia bacterium]